MIGSSLRVFSQTILRFLAAAYFLKLLVTNSNPNFTANSRFGCKVS